MVLRLYVVVVVVVVIVVWSLLLTVKEIKYPILNWLNKLLVLNTETLGKFCAELKLIENFKNILHTSSYPQNLLSFTIGESTPSMGNISFQF